MEKNIIAHSYKIGVDDRRKMNGHHSFLIFFTGLSGSGKSTLANALEEKLHKNGLRTYVLDGDNVRQGINSNLSFEPEDRSENLRRIGEVSKLFVDAGIIVLAAFIAPYKKDRDFIKKTVGETNYIEVFVNTSLEVCEQRDVKGLYAKARSGEIKNMTGVSAPYESPINPDVEVSNENSIQESVDIIYDTIKNQIRLKK
ncbi:adenylyl-sulfate kinase [Flagellimonas meridianipacifica]|uniref:Adenylyl-sulfate kinase n=1 Tax=Flagellimonas meridianipacifica TaxID=1080225 RepID=A0A2T0MCT7_9FLAO|nr:adenylyl-sulfate kinase [Allomuricauda pacifica]PRX55289.1 adenylylsulfate kinase [Allomuricauda pacifica]